MGGWIKGTKCALFSIKCKGAVWKKHSYEVNFLLLFLFHSAFQKMTIAFLHTSITLRDSWLWMFMCVHFLQCKDNLCFIKISFSFYPTYLWRSISAKPNHTSQILKGGTSAPVRYLMAACLSHRLRAITIWP